MTNHRLDRRISPLNEAAQGRSTMKKANRLQLVALWIVTLLTVGCASTTHPKSNIPKPSHEVSPAIGYPAANQASLPMSNVQK
jgi:hypothetical protein